MQITLSPETEQRLQNVMAAADFTSPEDAIAAALYSYGAEDIAKLKALRAAIDEGDKAAERGGGILWYPGLMDQFIERAKERAAQIR